MADSEVLSYRFLNLGEFPVALLSHRSRPLHVPIEPLDHGWVRTCTPFGPVVSAAEIAAALLWSFRMWPAAARVTPSMAKQWITPGEGH